MKVRSLLGSHDHDLIEFSLVSRQFSLASRVAVLAQDVGKHIRVLLVGQPARSVLWHRHLDPLEHRPDRQFGPENYKVAASNARCHLAALHFLAMTRCAVPRVDPTTAACLRRGKHTIEHGGVLQRDKCFHSSPTRTGRDSARRRTRQHQSNSNQPVHPSLSFKPARRVSAAGSCVPFWHSRSEPSNPLLTSEDLPS